MKSLYIIILLVFLFAGCSSTYLISNFPSKEKFYEDFNNSTNEKPLVIMLKNDSIFTAINGAKISNDSLLIVKRKVEKLQQIISKNEVSLIEYISRDIPDKIILKNGKSLNFQRAKVLQDSIIIFDLENVYESLPLNKVEKISYKDQWSGFPYPVVISTLLGAGVGINLLSQIAHDRGWYNQGSPTPYIDIGLAIGSGIGLLTGLIIYSTKTYNYIYEFHP